MYNSLKQHLEKIVKKIESRHLEDPIITELIHEMVVPLLENEQITIDFLNNCKGSEARIIYWLCPLFDEIGDKFPSNQMANALTSLIERYPEDEGLPRNIQYAIDVIHTIQNES